MLDRISRELFEFLPLRLRYRLYFGETFIWWMAFLRESEFWDRGKMEVFQFEELKGLLQHAVQHVPYYRKLFPECSLDPARLQSPEDIRKIPYLTRKMVNGREREFVATNFPQERLLKKSTSGSTGTPLTIYENSEAREKGQAFLYDFLGRVGYTPKKRIAFFQWRPIELGRRKNLMSLRYGNKLVMASSLTGDGAGLEESYWMLRRFRPEFISGYRTVLLVLASYIREKSYPPLEGLRALCVYSETVGPLEKRVIEEAFGARLHVSYGMRETVAFGGFCEVLDQYHMYPQYGIVEFRDAGEGRSEIVGTGFVNYVMPLVRYRTLDFGVKGPAGCPRCGRSHLLIENIDGRLHDFLVTRNGRLVMGGIADVDTDAFRNVRQTQFFQDEPGVVYLKLVVNGRFSASEEEAISSEVQGMIGVPRDELDLRVCVVEEVLQSASGKVSQTDQRLNVQDYLKI